MFADQDSGSRKGSAIDKLVLFCALVSIACVLGAHGIDKLAQVGALPMLGVNRGQVDYAPTASISNRAAATQINPCELNPRFR